MEAPVCHRSFLQHVQMEGRGSIPVLEKKFGATLPDGTGGPLLPPIILHYTPGDLGPFQCVPQV